MLVSGLDLFRGLTYSVPHLSEVNSSDPIGHNLLWTKVYSIPRVSIPGIVISILQLWSRRMQMGEFKRNASARVTFAGGRTIHCTTTVRAMFWLTLPAVAVTVTSYFVP